MGNQFDDERQRRERAYFEGQDRDRSYARPFRDDRPYEFGDERSHERAKEWQWADQRRWADPQRQADEQRLVDERRWADERRGDDRPSYDYRDSRFGRDRTDLSTRWMPRGPRRDHGAWSYWHEREDRFGHGVDPYARTWPDFARETYARDLYDRDADEGRAWSRDLGGRRSEMDGARGEGHRMLDDLKRGVRRVFRGLKGYTRSDDRIREDVCDRINDLSERMNADVSEVEVRVQNGDVTLTGALRDRWHKHLVENAADSVGGVKDIHNQIRVRRDEQPGQPGDPFSRSTEGAGSQGRGTTGATGGTALNRPGSA
jgi:hypothetical protein